MIKMPEAILTATDAVVKQKLEMLQKTDFNEWTTDDKLTYTTLMIKCVIQSMIAVKGVKSAFFEKLINSNQWIMNANGLNGTKEVLLMGALASDVAARYSGDVAKAEFEKVKPKMWPLVIAPDSSLGYFKWTIENDQNTSLFREFTSLENINSFIAMFSAAYEAGDAQQIFGLCAAAFEKALTETATINPADSTMGKTRKVVYKAIKDYRKADGSIDEALLEKAQETVRFVCEDMRLTKTKYNAMGVPDVVEKGTLTYALPWFVDNTLKTYKQGLYRPYALFPDGITVDVVLPEELGEGQSENITREGYETLVLNGGKTVDSSKIFAMVFDNKITAFKRPTTVIKTTQSASGDYINFFAHKYNAQFGFIPDGIVPCVVFVLTDDGTFKGAPTKSNAVVAYDPLKPGHLSRESEFTPVE